MVLGLVATACSEEGAKVETKEAVEVQEKVVETSVNYTQVAEGSYIDWRAAHLGGVEPRFGKVMMNAVEVVVNNGAISNATLEMDMTSFTVDNFEDEESRTKLSGHLQSDDFFKVATYPTTKFELTGITAGEGEYNSTITGNLTILDQTKSISFKANVNVTDAEVSVQSEDFVIDRTDWGLTYNVEGTEGVPADYLISNDIGFTVHVSVSK